MKGIVFKEFLEMTEKVFGDEVLEEVILKSELESGGAYTSVGTYDYNEILTLVTQLSSKTSTSVKDLVKTFGRHLAVVFKSKYPDFFKPSDIFEFLENVEGIIHVEVKKLYPEAELPKFIYERQSSNRLVMKYSSSRPFADLAEGLLEGVIEIYGGKVKMTMADTSSGENTSRDFALEKE